MYLSALYVWGHGSISGRRPSNEDAHIIRDLRGMRQDLSESITMAGVFDGHGGPNASAYTQEKLPLQLTKARAFPTDVKDALKQAFLNTDRLYLRDEGHADIYSSAGTTAVACVHYRNVFFFANAGDSRAIIGTSGQGVRQITVDHKPNLPGERARIERAGSCVVDDEGDCPRVAGMLAVSRAIGDAPFKSCGVIADPDIFAVRDSEIDYVVLACDGLWDVFQNDEVDAVIRHIFRLAPRCTDPSLANQILTSDLSSGNTSTTRLELLKHAAACLLMSNDPKDKFVSIATSLCEKLAVRDTALSFGFANTIAGGFKGFDSCYDECNRTYVTPARKLSPEAIASYLMRMAMCLGSDDNITIVLGLGRKLYPKPILAEYDKMVRGR